MKKTIISLLLAATTLCLTACGEDSGKGINEETVTVTDNISNGEVDTSEKKTEEVSTEEPTTLDKEAIKAQRNEELKQRMEQTKVSVVSKTTMAYEDAMINGYGYRTDEYDTATILTLLVEFPDGELYDDYKTMTIYGENVTDADGELIPNTYSSTGWKSQDEKYMVLLMRVAGDVDPTTFGVQMKCAIYEKTPVYVELSFENGGNEVGFDHAVECFSGENAKFGQESAIVKIKGRHYYAFARPFGTSYYKMIEGVEMGGDIYTYILFPLEGGLTQTLTTADAVVTYGVTHENTVAKITVNDGHELDSQPDFQTVIAADVYRITTEEDLAILDGDDEEAGDALQDQMNKECSEVKKNTKIGFDDGDGNMIYFVFD